MTQTIKLLLTAEEAPAALQLVMQLIDESRFREFGIDVEAVWKFFEMAVNEPQRCCFLYSKDEEGKMTGFFSGFMQKQFFNGRMIAQDMGIYILPELRGTRLFLKLLKEFETWAKDSKADAINLSHNTGIESDTMKDVFPRLGYKHFGYSFEKGVV